MAKRALVILAPGAEEMEAVIIIDVLRRGGVEVIVAGLDGDGPVECSRQVRILPEISLTDASLNTPYDAVILPGGLKGAEALSKSTLTGQILKEHESSGKIVAAICAGPLALKSHSIGKGKKITSYPAMKEQLIDDYQYVEDRVVVADNVTTSRGPGTAFEFSLSLVEQLAGNEATPHHLQTLANQMLLKF